MGDVISSADNQSTNGVELESDKSQKKTELFLTPHSEESSRHSHSAAEEKDNNGLVRSHSSPALGKSQAQQVGVAVRRLSDVSAVLFSTTSTKNLEVEKDTATSSSKTDDLVVVVASLKAQTRVEKKEQPKPNVNDPPPPPPPPLPSLAPAAPVVQSTSQTTQAKRRQGRPLKKQENKGRDSSILKMRPNTAPSKDRRDLLARFKVYNDQLGSRSSLLHSDKQSNSNRQYAKLGQKSPKRKSTETNSTTQSQSTLHSDEIQMCSIQQQPSPLSNVVDGFTSPESLIRRVAKKTSPASSPCSSIRYPRSIVPLLFEIVRIAVIMFSVASISSRLFSLFAGKMSSIYIIMNTPILWVVRFYIATFHLMLILVELDVGIPGVLPRGTLDNFFHKSHILGFIGNLELAMNTNPSFADLFDSDESPLSARNIQIRSAFAVLGVCSRGIISCGIIYLVFALIGWDGQYRRRIARGTVGLSKRTSTR